MNDDLKSAFARAYQDARDYVDQAVGPERERAVRYYDLRPLGTEEDGLSSAQMSVVRDTVNQYLPSLLRIFLASERVVAYDPVGPEDVEAAEQATDLVNHVILAENRGYDHLRDVLHDALLCKAGVTKWEWDTSVRTTTHKFSGLTPDEAALLQSDPEIEIVSMEVVVDGKVVQPDPTAALFLALPAQLADMILRGRPLQVPPEAMMGDPQVFADISINADVKRTRKKGRAVLHSVPPEEFLITRNSRTIEDADFVGHRRLVTQSDLVAMGFDVEDIERGAYSDDGLLWNREAMTRTMGHVWHNDESSEALKRVLYVEGYLRFDEDGDGIAELHKICALGGDTILYSEVVDEAPFALACPYPRPHQVIGDSLADMVMDQQEIQTHLLRGMLDSLSLSVNPRQVVVERDVNLDDVMASAEVGATIRARQQGAVTWQQVPFSGQFVLPVLDFMQASTASRVGISKASAGLDPDALQSTTKAAVTATVEAAQESVEMVARNIAEGYFTRLARGLLRLIIKHQDRPRAIRMRGKWVNFDPRYWDAEMDARADVALGRGDTTTKLASLGQIAAMQERVMQQLGMDNPFIGPNEFRQTWAQMIQLMGHKDASRFVREVTPETIMAYQQQSAGQPPPADQLLAQAEIAKAQAQADKIRVDAEVELARIELEREKIRLDADHKRDMLDAEIAIKSAELRLKDGQLDVASINSLIAHERNLIAAQRGVVG